MLYSEDMNKKFIIVYIYPLFSIIFGFFSWYLFAKFVLKIDFDSFLYQSLECETEACVTSFKIFFFSMLMFLYISWVFFNKWIENSKNVEEREKKAERFFMAYGKAFAAFIFCQFFFILLAVMML